MNGTNLQETLQLSDTLGASSVTVLETMFFAEALPAEGAPSHVDPIACLLHASGAQNGTFSVAIDRAVLVALCESFYGETPNATQPFELLCEFTNMVAGSTLSAYSPDRFCPLSSPQLCDINAHLDGSAAPGATLLWFTVEGGLVSVRCSLRTA